MNPIYFNGTENPLSVAECLARSVQAHKAAKATTKPGARPANAKAKWEEARAYRRQALTLDPEMKDPAWGLDPVDHQVFMIFYAQQLGPETE